MIKLTNCPYPGLRPFREDEANLFFGREQKIEEMLAKLEEHRFLAVIGTSGCGKSSLVSAGLLPALREGLLSGAAPNWRIAVMKPGESPYDRLTDALLSESALAPERGMGPRAAGILQAALHRGPLGLIEAVKESRLSEDTSFLLVVDQFEEIFRYRRQSGHPEDADAFVRLMLTSADPHLTAKAIGEHIAIFVIMTMRSDYIGDCAIFAGLPEAINSGLFLTPRLNRAEYEAAIVEPARIVGGSIPPSLANRLLNDVRAEPDQLPVLQHALMRMWVKVAKSTTLTSDQATPNGSAPVELTLDDYKDIGGLSKALSNHADEALAELEPSQRRLAEVMFRCLCERGSHGRETRRPAKMRDIAAAADAPWENLRSVVECFRRPDRSFIMPAVPAPLKEDTFLDISHESLIRQWQTLNEWVKSEDEYAEAYQRLADAASRWKKGLGEPWRKRDLNLALDWKQAAKPTAAWAARYGGDFDLAMEFLGHSRQESEKEAREKEEQIRKELERTRQLAAFQAKKMRQSRFIALVFIVATFLCLLLAGYAWMRNEEATALREYDYVREVTDRAKLEADRNPKLGLLLATESLRVIEESERRQASPTIPSEVRFLNSKLMAFLKMNIEPTKTVGEVLPAATGSLRMALRKSEKRFLSETRSGHKAPITSIAVNNDGTRFVSASLDGELKLWDAKTLSEIDCFVGHKNQNRQKATQYGINLVVFSPNGKLLATASKDHTARILEYDQIPESESFKEIHTFKHDDEVQAVAFSADSKFVATAGKDGKSKLWDVEAKKEYPLDGHTDTIVTLAFAPEGKPLLATGSKDKSVRIWDTKNHEFAEEIPSKYGEVYTVGWSSDGESLALGAEKGIQVYEIEYKKDEEPKHTLMFEKEMDEKVSSVAFNQLGTRLAAAAGKEVKLWDLYLGTKKHSFLENKKRFDHSERIVTLAFFPAGRHLVSVDRSGTVKIWTTGLLATFKSHESGIYSTALSPDGQRLITAGYDSRIRVWDTTLSGGEFPVLLGHTDAVRAIAFVNPEGNKLATASNDGSIRIWETKTEPNYPSVEVLKGPTDHASIYRFSRDGARLATAGRDGRVEVWSTESGTKLQAFSTHDSGVSALALSFDGYRLATAGTDQAGTVPGYTAKVWDIDTGKLLRSFSEDMGIIADVAFDSSGKRLAAVGLDGTATVWNIETGKLLSTVPGHSGRLHAVAFAPDGVHLATAGLDRTARIWNIMKEDAVLQTFFNFKGHKDVIYDVAFSPDTTYLATASADDTARLWDVASGRTISTFEEGADNINEVAFSPDGERLAAACEDGTIRLYLTKPSKLIQEGLKRNDHLKLKDCQSLLPLELRPCKPFLRVAEIRSLLEEGEPGIAKAVSEFKNAWSETAGPEALIDSRALLVGLDLDPALANNPEMAAQIWLRKELESLAQRQANQADDKGLKSTLESLKSLDPNFSEVKLKELAARAFENKAEALIFKARNSLMKGEIEHAIVNLEEAKKVYPEVKNLYSTLNDLCWKGILQDQSAKVLDACEQAVKSDPENGSYRDSRGVANAMTGNLEGVIEDFKAYVEWGASKKRSPARIDRRKLWIEQLEKGQNPFSGPDRNKILKELSKE